MKVVMSFKTPDVVTEAAQQAILHLPEEERDEAFDKILTVAEKWIEYQECITVEIDTDLESTSPAGNCPGCDQYHSGNTGSINGSIVLNKPVFVLGLSKDEVVADLRENLGINKGVVEQQKKELERLEKEVKDGETALEDQRNNNQLLYDQAERLRGEVKQKDKLEKHLTKAKKLVGERDWKREVLGEKE